MACETTVAGRVVFPALRTRNSPWEHAFLAKVKRVILVFIFISYLSLNAFVASRIFNGLPTRKLNDDYQGDLGPESSHTTVLQTRQISTAFTHGSNPGAAEIWARSSAASASITALADLLSNSTTHRLRALCGRCLYRTLTSYVRAHNHGRFTTVLTGDIAAMWLRDSAVQMATYIPRIARRPALRQVVEGAIRAQAHFILQVKV